jgi:Helix-turn-helix domain
MDTQSNPDLTNLFSGQYVKLFTHFLEHPSLSDRAKLLYCLLCRYYNRELGYSYPSQALLSETLNRDPKTIRHYLKELANAGLIIIHRAGQGENNHYALPYYQVELDREFSPIQNGHNSPTRSGKIPQESDHDQINDHDDQEDNLEKQWKEYIEEHQDTVRNPRAYLKKMLAKGAPPPQKAHTRTHTRPNQPQKTDSPGGKYNFLHRPNFVKIKPAHNKSDPSL